ncbi:FAD:protein FMN transferase [uncultured Mailhella sp.]|uniref:FAD:protein FMN transferase n=1 Tax=uncultured Mailhella sp. TaxID=1981031 RepID=UPI00262BFFEC|nr:FAD:protein FMN transferase [uncultured Mailhella sp.]
MITRRFFLECLTAAAASALPLPALARLSASEPVTETRLMMGTFVTIKISGVSRGQAADAAGRAFERMAELEGVLTRFDSASPLGELNRAGSLRDAPPALMTVMRAAARMHSLTAGAFDPTILPLLERLEEQPAGLTAREFAEYREHMGMDRVTLGEKGLHCARSGMKLSLDGIAKGYIADEGARLLHEEGVHNFLINAGGDLVASGGKDGTPWRVAVENPEKYRGRTAFPAVLNLSGQALATSGGYENVLGKGQGLNHILNPATGVCSTLPSASVLAPSALQADALATALCVLPQPLAFAETLPQAACLLVLPDGSTRRSSRWS